MVIYVVYKDAKKVVQEPQVPEHVIEITKPSPAVNPEIVQAKVMTEEEMKANEIMNNTVWLASACLHCHVEEKALSLSFSLALSSYNQN